MGNEKNGIEIPAGLLREFSSDQVNEEQQQKEKDAIKDFTTDLAEKSLSALASAFDEAAKERGGAGLGAINPDDYAKLGVIALEDIIPRKYLEDSPGYAFAVMNTYIIGSNLVAMKRAQKNENQAAEKNENKND